jgi:hypothetical protein
VARIHQAANICKLPATAIVNPLTFLLPTGPVTVRRRQFGPSQPEPVLFLITASGDPPLFFPPRVRHRHRNLTGITRVRLLTRTVGARFNAEHRRVPRFYYCTV